MRYRLAHSREIKKNRWNNVCPECGRRGKFSPYIDTVTNEPIAAKECGRCCREKSCAYHMTPGEWFKEHPTEKREWLPREQYIELMRQRRREAAEIRKQSTNSPSVYRGSTAEPGGSSKRSAEQGDTTRYACNAPALTGTHDSVVQGTEKACKQDAFVKLKFQSAQPTLSHRVGPSLSTACHQGSPLKASFAINRGGVEEYCKRMNDLCHKSRSDQNNLARWLCTQFPAEQVAEVLARYRTGSTRDGRIIYWQIDEHGQVHAGKVMAYGLDGHRRKEGKDGLPQPPPEEGACRHRGQPPVCWVHSMKIDGIKFDEMLAPQCLFGLHLASPPALSRREGAAGIADSESPLFGRGLGEAAIVESEKTALIMSLVCPDRLWLATGGKANFKESMLWPLLGHEVAVYPDADALRDWELRIAQLNRELGHRLYIPTGYYNLMDHEEPRREGWDLADAILREEGRGK